jgi:hypothetical protein
MAILQYPPTQLLAGTKASPWDAIIQEVPRIHIAIQKTLSPHDHHALLAYRR